MQPVNDYFAIDVDNARRIVRIVRSSVPTPAGTADVGRVFGELRAPLAKFVGYRLLLDLRAITVGRNDPAFEEAAIRGQTELAQAFSRVAVLVRTAAGKLQTRRMTGSWQGVFQDEAEAIRYLTGE
jgi:hypothetical protein